MDAASQVLDQSVLIPAPSAWFDSLNNDSNNNNNNNEPYHREEETEEESWSKDSKRNGALSPVSTVDPQRIDIMTTTYLSNENESDQNNKSSQLSFHSLGLDSQILQDSPQQPTLPNLPWKNHFGLEDGSTFHHHHPRGGNNHQQHVGAPLPSPSWTQISSQVLPAAARELLSSSLLRIGHSARLTFAVTTKWQNQYREIGNTSRGFFRKNIYAMDLPHFSSLPWIERQMVQEWRTDETILSSSSSSPKNYSNRNTTKLDRIWSLTEPLASSETSDHSSVITVERNNNKDDDEDENEFHRARTLVPKYEVRPTWQLAETCFHCYKPFGPSRLRHHCRLCGCSFCQRHSSNSHLLPQLGYQVAERVCDGCKGRLVEQELAERVAWRLARCRDFREHTLCPYFALGLDTLQDMVLRITHAAITMAKTVPLGAQATVAVETLEVLRRHGLNGIYTILLRQEFLAAADLLRKALGINRASWPLSVHELSAAIFYALAQHRAYRGLHPDLEHQIHALRNGNNDDPNNNSLLLLAEEEDSMPFPSFDATQPAAEEKIPDVPRQIMPVCEHLSDATLNALIFYAPLALNFVYVEKEVDMQLLAAQQGWRLLYAYLHQDDPCRETRFSDSPASAVFIHEKHKIVCLAIRGTTTMNDVITDVRQMPVLFPEPEMQKASADNEWISVSNSQGLAVSGMAGAALNLYREHVDSLVCLAQDGYRIRLVGHSLGGGVASLLGVLLRRDMPVLEQEVMPNSESPDSENVALRVYTYGTPACVDARLSDIVESLVVTVVLHDDVVPRLSPSSCRGLLKHLLYIRDTWVKEHLPDDIIAITERAKHVWAPRWREGFTLIRTPSSSSFQRYWRKQYRNGKKQLLSMKDLIRKVADDQFGPRKGFVVASDSSTLWKLSTEAEFEVKLHEPESFNKSSWKPHFVVDFMGGINSTSGSIIIDGEKFYEAEAESLVEDENDQFEDALDDLARLQEKEKLDALLQTEIIDPAIQNNNASSNDESPETVLLAETPLPRLYVPGKIGHIYSHRGVYRVAYVPRSFRELRRISMAGNMLSDHTCKAYYEALLEVRSVRRAPENPPRWTAFDDDDTCSCCASRFTWASTSDSKAQEARDKHNCRSCGTLVCDPCSSNRIPMPSIGVTSPVRVCDRCYHEGETDITVSDLDKPERTRPRRSEVVDELAQRIARTGGPF